MFWPEMVWAWHWCSTAPKAGLHSMAARTGVIHKPWLVVDQNPTQPSWDRDQGVPGREKIRKNILIWYDIYTYIYIYHIWHDLIATYSNMRLPQQYNTWAMLSQSSSQCFHLIWPFMAHQSAEAEAWKRCFRGNISHESWASYCIYVYIRIYTYIYREHAISCFRPVP